MHNYWLANWVHPGKSKQEVVLQPGARPLPKLGFYHPLTETRIQMLVLVLAFKRKKTFLGHKAHKRPNISSKGFMYFSKRGESTYNQKFFKLKTLGGGKKKLFRKKGVRVISSLIFNRKN